ncbi:MAG: hypothetical protein ACRD1R_01430 [Acidobacteriota bacterium]
MNRDEREELNPKLARLQRKVLVAGIIALGLSTVGAFLDAKPFFFSYLIGYMFILGLSLGSLAFLMIHHLTNGRWGFSIQSLLESAAGTLLPVGLLFLPVLLGLHELYEWTHHEAVAQDPVLLSKSGYLNIPFFLIRMLLYFLIWVTMAFLLGRWSREQDRTGDPTFIRRMQTLSAPGLLIFGVTVTFAATDLVMSLEPHWFSTIFGMLFMVGFGLSGIAAAIIAGSFLLQWDPLSKFLTPARFHELGNLLLALVMLYAYLSFSQWLIIWAADLPEEVSWYVTRTDGGWQWIAALLALFHFALPFALLLNRFAKRRMRALRLIAVLLLFMRLVDWYWMIGPVLHGPELSLHWLTIVTPVGLIAIWMALYLWQLKSRPLMPINDPRVEPVFTPHHEAVEHG